MAITLFTNQVPAVLDVNSFDVALTLGTQWYSEADGAVHAIRFYLGNRNFDNRQITVGLYQWIDNSTGTLLAQKNYTVTAADPLGFLSIPLDRPVLVTRNQTYVAAVWLPGAATAPDNNAHYAYTADMFSLPLDNPPLHAFRNDIVFNHKANGSFTAGNSLAYPTQASTNSASFFVDVVFDYVRTAKVKVAGVWTEKPLKTRVGGGWRL